MIFRETTLKDAWLIEIEPRRDIRGSFARTMCAESFAAHGLAATYVQRNTSVSKYRGTVRGMHFQRGEFAEAKLVRVVKGALADIIVDLRPESPTYLQHQKFELAGDSPYQLYVPPGFAHGFQTLTDDVEVDYLMSSNYTPSAEGGVRYNDPLLGLSWPLPVTTISDKDASWPLMEGRRSPFLLAGFALANCMMLDLPYFVVA